jgi:hypothetical protein
MVEHTYDDGVVCSDFSCRMEEECDDGVGEILEMLNLRIRLGW